MKADRDSWQNEPAPAKRETFTADWEYPREMGDRMSEGHIPRAMEDRWFIMMEDGWLLFHRSWTGYCTFALKVEQTGDGVRITEGWASRDNEQYRSDDIGKDVALIRQLIDTYFKGAPPYEDYCPFVPVPVE